MLNDCIKKIVVQSLSRVLLFVTLWTAARQASPSFTISQSWICSSSCPLSQWCHHLTISFPVVPFSSCPQSFPASESFLVSQLFSSGGQSIRASASASVLQWIFRVDFLWSSLAALHCMGWRMGTWRMENKEGSSRWASRGTNNSWEGEKKQEMKTNSWNQVWLCWDPG